MKQCLSLGVLLLFVAMLIISCEKNSGHSPTPPITEVKDTTKPIAANPQVISPLIGTTYQGGIIFYVDSTGQHGLIMATSDQSAGIKWCNNCDTGFIRTTATDSKIGSGVYNTNKIVKQFKDGQYAAKLCADLVLNGYHDWFLPSQQELREIAKNINFLKSSFPNTSDFYWSSTDLGGGPTALYAFNLYLPSVFEKFNLYMLKGYPNRVRAVRAF